MRTVVTVAVITQLLVVASSAEAATSVGRQGAILLVRAAQARTNTITVESNRGDLIVHDFGDSAVAGNGCRAESSSAVRCSAGSIHAVFVEAGDRNDVVAVNTTIRSLVHGDTGDDTLSGGPENDRLVGEDGDDTLDGRVGDDHLNGGLGEDRLIGGGGEHDAARYREKSDPVRVDLDGEADDGTAGEGDNVNFDVEDVYGGSAGDTLAGSSGPNLLDGGAGARARGR